MVKKHAGVSQAGTAGRPDRCRLMPPVEPPRFDPERQPEEARLARRSNNPAISPWLVIGVLLLLGLVIYVASAVLT